MITITVATFMVASALNGPVQALPERTSGVYATADDYAVGKLTDAGNCQAAPFKVALHDITNKPFIDVTAGASRKRYAKSEVFGVRMCDGHDYRLASDHLYRILETGPLQVYAVERPVSQGKGFKVVPAYYFSSGARGEVLPLTLENLQRAFSANHKFVDSLDRIWGQDLAEFDAYHRQFRVSRLLAESSRTDQ